MFTFGLAVELIEIESMTDLLVSQQFLVQQFADQKDGGIRGCIRLWLDSCEDISNLYQICVAVFVMNLNRGRSVWQAGMPRLTTVAFYCDNPFLCTY